MNLSDHLLTVITFLPTLGALILLFVGGKGGAADNLVRWIALVVTAVTAVLSLVLWAGFDQTNTGFQFVENYDWIGKSIGYRMGVDGISVLFIPLTAVLMPAVILSSWGSITTRVREYMIVFLILETFMIGAFAMSGSLAIKFTKRFIAAMPSSMPSSMLMSMTCAPFSTC